MSSPVYPRRCGEHASSEVSPVGVLGLSPQVRGTRRESRRRRRSHRFIPAGAGNTPTRENTEHLSTVYPRRCGEHELLLRLCRDKRGLSPQVRGTRTSPSPGPARRRFIPAGAGNTWLCRGRCSRSTVYPRRCGEHVVSQRWPKSMSGLSPQVRGTLSWYASSNYYQRFIPAGAGNTRLPLALRRRLPVYPRRCGEHRR